MLSKIKKIIQLDNPLRLIYHKIRAIIANFRYAFPHKDMIIIGVTGTNGKTTTCNIIAEGLREAGEKVFMFSTVNIIVNDENHVNNSKMTSPDVFMLQEWLSYAKSKGCKYAVIETASHGIIMNRIWGLNYDIVALTNITQDHLDLHRTIDKYVQTKLQIFKKLMYYSRKKGIKKTAVINLDSEYSHLFIAETSDTLLTYGNDYKANLKPSNIKYLQSGIEFQLEIPGENINITTSLNGEFNIYNIMCAVGVFTSLGFSRKLIQQSIARVTGIPGRMERVDSEEGFSVYIDYAHTPDALENILNTINGINGTKRIITVFGATGDRDTSKRITMGQIVSEKSDVVILTEDDNYTENVQNIIKDILPGVERKEGEDFWIIPDRKEAIRTALISAQKGDVVLIAGKGDEHSIIRNSGPEEWHDRTVTEKILAEIKENHLVK